MVDAETLTHIVRTGRNGQLDGMTPDDVAAIVALVGQKQRIVLHFHGGLNSRADGELTAARWRPIYKGAGADPVFFVWESGFLDTITHNLDEIAQDVIFKQLMKWVLKYVVGKVQDNVKGRAVTDELPLPDNRTVNSELARVDNGEEPFAEVVPTSTEKLELSDTELAQLERDVRSDDDLSAALGTALATRTGSTRTTGTRGITLRVEGSASTLLDPGVLDEMAADAGQRPAGERSIAAILFFAKKAVAVARAVFGRYRSGTDSGVYPTVLEEVLRAFYLANAGGAVWQAMKKETSDTFEVADPARGGRLVVDGLATALASLPAGSSPPDITLVGHSTGAVFIDNFLADVVAAHERGGWPDDVTFQVVLLAPAATFGHLTNILPAVSPVVRRLRMFTMSDSAERADHLVGPLYPRSLLYFVSGVVERNRDSESVVEAVVGLDRYYGPSFGTRSDLSAVRDYMGGDHRVILSPSPETAPVGRRTKARSHTAFNTDADVAASVVALIDGSAT